MKPAPLHERIRSEIEAAILAGDLRPGDRIPRETDLMAEYGCARMTVNKALSALAGSGMVERRKRAGSFVAQPRAQAMVEAGLADILVGPYRTPERERRFAFAARPFYRDHMVFTALGDAVKKVF